MLYIFTLRPQEQQCLLKPGGLFSTESNNGYWRKTYKTKVPRMSLFHLNSRQHWFKGFLSRWFPAGHHLYLTPVDLLPCICLFFFWILLYFSPYHLIFCLILWISLWIGWNYFNCIKIFSIMIFLMCLILNGNGEYLFPIHSFIL